MNSFSARIKNIEARMNQLKTFGLSSSSSVKTISKTVSITFTIVPYKVNYEWDNCHSSQSARIYLNWNTQQQGLCSAYIKSPANLQNRRIVLDRLTTSNYASTFGLDVLSGSGQDLAYFNNGGSPFQMAMTIEVVATADFSLSYTMRQK